MTHSLQINKETRYRLSNGREIPAAGYGVYDVPKNETADLVYKALEIGYRHIDTAVFYGNQIEVAEGIARFIKETDVTREDIFFTTKLWNGQQGYDETKEALAQFGPEIGSLIGYIDLFLLHSALPGKEKRLGTWRALEEVIENPAAAPIELKSIGVSNFGVEHLEELLAVAKVKPVVDQIELHPWLPQLKLRKYLADHDILVEAYSPLTQGKKLNDPELLKWEQEYGVSKVKLLLEWSFLQGVVVLAKSGKAERIKQNLAVLEDPSGTVSLPDNVWDALNKPDSHEVLTWGQKDPTVYKD